MDSTETVSMRQQQVAAIKAHIAAAVDEAIEDLLGTSVVEAFEAYLLERGVSRDNLASKVEILCSALDDTFEDSSLTIQRAIARRLFAKVGLTFAPIENAGLLEYIRKASRGKV